MGFDEATARKVVLEYCSHYSPRTLTSIARHLKKSLPGFYSKTPASKLQKQLRRLLTPLATDGLLVKYTPHEKVWGRAREMATKSAQAAGEPAPRNTRELYQTSFLLAGAEESVPVVRLPPPNPELNFELCALLHRFANTRNRCWETINLLMCSSEKTGRDELRLHLYALPFDYNEIELLENVLYYGEEFADMKLPLKPSMEEAKGFLTRLGHES